MLHKSFKPAKCKTALKMASSRIKLLKNKREAHVKQLRRELAQLLEAGQDQTARIRVEHVVREEKTLAAYDLIDIYCELIVARLPMIESQKTCPVDLKEAVASVIFAGPRCADIPELMDVRKHFTAKYGKEFVSASVELRPDCGVGRLLIEKLSANAPDGPTKIKILSAIAEEHNIKWEPKSFGEKDAKPPDDLLNGPSTPEQAGKLRGPTTFEQASKLQMEPIFQEPPHNIEKGPPNFQVPFNHYEKHDGPIKSYGPSSGSSSHPQNFPSANIGHYEATSRGTSNPDLGHLGTGGRGTELRHQSSGDERCFSIDGQSWNMEFKDATAAAQAAAESAERASMAARAAAELSSRGRISRQHSTESRKTAASGLRDEGRQRHTRSKFPGDQLAKGPVNNNFHEQSYGAQHEQIDDEQNMADLDERFNNLKSSNKSSHLASSKSSSASVGDYPSANDMRMTDKHSRKSSSELDNDAHFSGKASVEGESSESEVEFESRGGKEMTTETIDHFEESSIRKQSSSVSSRNYSQNFIDNHNVVPNFYHPDSDERTMEDPFTVYEAKNRGKNKETNLDDHATVVFDDYGSDNDEYNLDMERKSSAPFSTSYSSSEGRKPSFHMFSDTNASSTRLNVDESARKSSSQSIFASEEHPALFSEDLGSDAVTSQPDDSVPVTFDNSDASSSESEGEAEESKFVQGTSIGAFHHNESFQSGKSEPTYARSQNKTWSQPSSLDSDVLDSRTKRNQENEASAEIDRELGYGDLHNRRPSSRLVNSESNSSGSGKNLSRHSSMNDQACKSADLMEDATPSEEPSLEDGKGLNFGLLTGGLRHKGYGHLPFRGKPSNDSLSSKPEENSTSVEQSSSPPKVEVGSGKHSQKSYDQTFQPPVHKKTGSKMSDTYFDSSDDDSDEELPHQAFRSSQVSHDWKAESDQNKKSSVRTYFGSDGSNSVEDSSKQSSTATRFSRRTKASPLSSKASVFSDSLETKDYLMGRKSSRGLGDGEAQPKSKSESTADYWENSEQHEQRPSHSIPQSKRSSHVETSSRRLDDAETQPKLMSQTKDVDYWANAGHNDETASQPITQSKRSSHGKTSSRSSYARDTQQNLQPRFKTPDYWGSSENPKPPEKGTSSSEPKRSLHEETRKSSAPEQPSNPPKTATSGGAENLKTSTKSAEPPSRESSINRASHVHPKLPDYDTFAAHLLSLRQNRQ